MKEPSYRSRFREPRSEHLSFASGKPRFGERTAVFSGHMKGLSNPGPAQYEPPEGQSVGFAKSTVKRKPNVVGCTAEAVGPGRYELDQSTLLKKTFNVSVQVPKPSGAK